MAPNVSRTLRVLYLYAGPHRRAELGTALREVAKLDEDPADIEIEELDILRGRKSDLSVQSRQNEIIAKILTNYYDLVVSSPPCETFCRALYTNKLGPRPIRSSAHPRGFPWLTGAAKIKCDLANAHVDFSLRALRAAAEVGTRALLEHPEDLGRSKLGTQGTIWQWPELRTLEEDFLNFFTGAFSQCAWHIGLPYKKPTRLLTDLALLEVDLYTGWPSMDAEGWYLGPVPKDCGHNNHSPLIQRADQPSGVFQTSGTGSYPWGMCMTLARAILHDEVIMARVAKRTLKPIPTGGTTTLRLQNDLLFSEHALLWNKMRREHR